MNARLWYIDSLRACLMIAGVFLHAAEMYGQHTDWVVRDPSTLGGLDLLVAMVSSSRMPAFFVLAGMFFSHALASRPLGEVLHSRSVLVATPFVVLALTLQPVQYAVLLAHQGRLSSMGLGEFWSSFVQPSVLSTHAFIGRGFVGHLWFLVNLLLYYHLAALAVWAVRRYRAPSLQALGLLCMRHKWLWVLLAGGAMVCGRAALRAVDGLHDDWADLVRYLPYFALGAFAFANKARFQALLTLGPADLVALPVAAAVVFVPALNQRVHGALVVLLHVFVATMVTVLLLRLFLRWFNQHWPLQQRLVDASFSIYLFHYICVVGVGLLLLPVQALPHIAKYAIAVAVGVWVPFMLHERLIKPYPRMRLLLNGRLPKTKPLTVKPVAAVADRPAGTAVTRP
ncbi:acyltransferase family protein [Ideonella sp. BN130291]|uniref:acyltransferase family protein n=1 Tax=Ideonella sp. BN130291 TaxID=3112940 RepID=UPI002E25AF08|nr:acyltransferase family protein [Ideonella sp. BN130291]